MGEAGGSSLDDGSSEEATDDSTRTQNLLLLSGEERFDIWQVKQEERPHWMGIETNISERSDSENSVSDQELPLPLIDGCDIPGWRGRGLVSVSDYHQSILNVGTGCSLLRRESQLPILSSRSTENWRRLRDKLLKPPSRSIHRLSPNETNALGPYPWFERDNIPVLLEGCTDSWKAMETCTWKALVETYGDYDWRFSDTHGSTMTLSTYDKYCRSLEGQTDDAPLAVYDSQLVHDERSHIMMDDYQVPNCFDAPDLFESMGEDRRPPYRWILMGPERSGTGLHIDPMGTHAWVTIVEGIKRWVLFPYGTDQASIGMQDPQIPSALWFQNYYDHVLAKYPEAIEVLQYPGETVYVPAGWPHLVLNLDRTVAITQNYATEYPSMDRMARHVVRDEGSEFFDDWMACLKETRPDLVHM